MRNYNKERKMDLIFFTSLLDGEDLDYNEIEQRAEKKTAKEIWKNYSRSLRKNK